MKPFSWTQSVEAGRFWPRLRAARRSVLMLDYDGTLAPFKNDPSSAFPYPGVAERLATLSGLPAVRLVLVSGRPACDLAGLLGSLKFEIWGDHGRERLQSDGCYELEPLNPRESEVLKRMKSEIEGLGFAAAMEAKPASLAVHWRASDPATQQEIRSSVESLYARHAGESELHLLAFDGGLELRSKDRDKATAVEQILAEEEVSSGDLAAAYLGDDLTDEDAFRALGNRGVSILVRNELRPSSAQFWIRPPEELLEFLDGWIQSSGSSSAPSSGRNGR